MNRLRSAAARLADREDGLATIEYAVAGALVTAAIVTAFTDVGVAVAARIVAITGLI